jgi:predicted phage terminase large subunit-like protein
MGALQYVHIPGYAALLLRKSYADLTLPGALMTRAHDWLAGTDARWDDRAKAYRFPEGASVSFGYLERDEDMYRYKGAEFQYIGIDELTQHNERPYRYLFSRLRRLEGSRVPLRMRAASNPGDRGHDWVKARFIDPGDPDRPFIPAKLGDNPSLDREEYERSLMELDPVTREQLLNGDWSARAGGSKFRREWFEVVDAAPAFERVVRYWDMAASEPKRGADPDYTVGVLLGRTEAGQYYVVDVRRLRAKPLDVERAVAQCAKIDGVATAIRMEQEPGASGVQAIDHYRREVLPAYDFEGVRSTGPKEVRANPLSSQAHAGNVKILRARWNADYLDELEAFPTAAHDDQVDATSGAFNEVHTDRVWAVA